MYSAPEMLIYVLRLEDKLWIGVQDAVAEKIALNAKQYPTHLARGWVLKHDGLR